MPSYLMLRVIYLHQGRVYNKSIDTLNQRVITWKGRKKGKKLTSQEFQNTVASFIKINANI